jgi:transposase
LGRTRWPELLLGLERVRVLEVARDGDGRLHVTIETTDELIACGECGLRAALKDRDVVGFADLPAFGAAVRLVWSKRRWACREPACGAQTWTEQRPDIAPARAALTTRAGLWATREVGAEVHTVAYVARQLGVTWHTVMDAVAYWGQPLIKDPNRVGQTTAVGVDEAKFLAARRREPTRWASAICDVQRRTIVDVIEGRQGPDLDSWLVERPEAWRQGVTVTVTDLHEPFRTALAAHLPNATAVADAFHVVAVGTRVVDRTRRRVQQETLGHRGREDDPLYRSRKLLTMAAERLDERGETKLRGLLAAGDPDGQVYEAWAVDQPALGAGSSRCSGGEAVEVAFEAGDDPLVAGGLGGPASGFSVVAELADVGELGFDYRGEVGGGDVVGAGLTDVGVGAGFGGEIAGAVAVGDAGLEHLRGEPLDPVRRRWPAG